MTIKSSLWGLMWGLMAQSCEGSWSAHTVLCQNLFNFTVQYGEMPSRPGCSKAHLCMHTATRRKTDERHRLTNGTKRQTGKEGLRGGNQGQGVEPQRWVVSALRVPGLAFQGIVCQIGRITNSPPRKSKNPGPVHRNT